MPTKKKKYNARFPPARIKKIMQMDEDVGKVAAPVPVIISRALELFVESLIHKSSETTQMRNARTLTTSHIKQTILSEKKFEFLKELVKNVSDVQPNEDECERPKPSAAGPPRARGRPRKKVLDQVPDSAGERPAKRRGPRRKIEPSLEAKCEEKEENESSSDTADIADPAAENGEYDCSVNDDDNDDDDEETDTDVDNYEEVHDRLHAGFDQPATKPMGIQFLDNHLAAPSASGERTVSGTPLAASDRISRQMSSSEMPDPQQIFQSSRSTLPIPACGSPVTPGGSTGFAIHRMPPVLPLSMSSASIHGSPRPQTALSLYRAQDTLPVPLRLPPALNESNKFN